MNTDHEHLLTIVRSVRNRWRLKVLLKGLAVLVAAAMGLLLASGWAIDASRFDAGTVAAVRIVVYLAFAALFARTVIWPLARRVSDERVALYLEEREPSLGGRVLAAVELGRAAGASSGAGTSAAMVERLVASAVEGCRRVDDGRRVERRALWRSSGLVAGTTAASFVFFLAGPAFLHTTAPVLLDPWKKPEVANPYGIRVEPGDATVARGSDLEVTAALQGFDAAAVELVVRSGEGEWTRWAMLRQDPSEPAHSEPAESGAAEPVFGLLVFDLHEPTEYFVESSGVRSAVFKVEVKELPYVEDIRLTYHFPPYTGLDPVEQTGSGDVAALVGTEVRLEVTATLQRPLGGRGGGLPVPGGAIAVDGGGELPLALGEEGRLAGSLTVGEPGVYRILLDTESDGRVVASPDYVIDPVADQPPTLVLARPGRDVQVTNLEEVVTEIRAQDDYGVARVELVYSVNGGEEETATLYSGRPGRKDFAGTHTLYLEEHELVPGDLISYFARARDAHGDPTHETLSDIYFLEVRPFDRDYRQADQAGQAGQMGGGSELSAQQRMIISATFKLARDRSRPPADAAADVATVAMSQGRLREQVLTLLERMLEQGMFGDGSPMSSMVELLPTAADEMRLAEEALGEHRLETALAPEQRALQYLQRMEAQFRDVQVTRGEQGGGGQGDISDELADLFEMERDQLRNQYEQVQRSRQEEVDEALDALLEKLRELARRQQQENERMRARARQAAALQSSPPAPQGARQTRAGSGGQSQRRLAEEAEEVARKLERLAREESLPDLAETARKLREAAEQMRRAAAAGERTDEALGSSALDQLREARRRLERDQAGRLDRDTRRALERTRRLREQQERVVDQVDRLDPADPRHDEILRSLMEAKERMGGEVGGLESELDQLARDFQREQPEASRRLKAAAEGIRDEQLREKILYSRGVVQERSKDYAKNFEQHIGDALGSLEERLREAAGAIGETREQRLGRALEETRDVVSALESLGERLEAGGANAANTLGGPEGSRGPRVGSGTGVVEPRDLRQLARELDERRLQLEGLRDRLRDDGVDPAELERIVDRLRELELGDPAAVLGTLTALENEVIQGLKEFEYGLRRSLGIEKEESLAQVTDDDVPDGYEEMVERYYKALAGER